MRNLLAFVAAAALTVGGAGWFLDWYRVRSDPAPSGYKSLSIDINPGKIGQDLHKGERGLQRMLEGAGKGDADKGAPGKGEADKAAAGQGDKTRPTPPPAARHPRAGGDELAPPSELDGAGQRGSDRQKGQAGRRLPFPF